MLVVVLGAEYVSHERKSFRAPYEDVLTAEPQLTAAADTPGVVGLSAVTANCRSVA